MDTTSSSFRIDGEFTIYRAVELAAAVQAALAAVPDGGALVVDLSEVAEMDSAGVQLLLAAKRSADESGRALRVSDRSPAASEVLAILRLTDHFGDALAQPH